MKRLLYLTILLAFSFQIKAQQHTIYFDFDIDEANNASAISLDKWLSEHKDAYVYKVYAYADKTGYAIYNIDLSQRRADYVMEKLKEYNIAIADTVDIEGFGEDFKQDPADEKNRKAVIYYIQPAPKAKPVEILKEATTTDFTKLVEKSKIGDKLRLPNLYFYNYSSIVVPKSEPILKELLQIMKDNPKLHIDIQGHICCQKVETGDISKKRAKAIYSYLVKNGIRYDRLSYQSFKSSKPIYPLPEKNDEERDANRRVEIEIIAN